MFEDNLNQTMKNFQEQNVGGNPEKLAQKPLAIAKTWRTDALRHLFGFQARRRVTGQNVC